MNPFEVERLGWDEIRGLPVVPDAEIGTGRFRIVCSNELDGEGLEEVEAVGQELARRSLRQITDLTRTGGCEPRQLPSDLACAGLLFEPDPGIGIDPSGNLQHVLDQGWNVLAQQRVVVGDPVAEALDSPQPGADRLTGHRSVRECPAKRVSPQLLVGTTE